MEPLDQTGSEDWEEIDVEEVERILSVVSDLLEATRSQNIQAILENACCELAALVEEVEEDEEVEELAAAA